MPTFFDHLCSNATEAADRPALWRKGTDGRFASVSWGTIFKDVVSTAEVLRDLRTGGGDRVVQISENSYEWILVDLALLSLRAVHIPLHAISTGAQLAAQIRHCSPKLILVSGDEQAAKLLGEMSTFAPKPALVRHAELSLAERFATKRAPSFSPPSPLSQQPATILYTSGTGGEPKGVLLSEQNLLANAQAILAAFGANPNELRLNLLPFSHTFARTCDLYVWVLERSQMALASSRESVLDDCRAIQPTRITAVPYFFDKVWRGLRERGLDQHAGSLRLALGGKIRVCSSGGAALSETLIAEYRRHGIPLLQGYGLTEAAPVVSACTEQADKPGTVGRPLPGVDVQIASDGEVLVRGENVMLGYLNDPAGTAAVLQNGWLHTGDLGHLDDDGYLTIVGRKKEIIVLTSGKNVAPAHLESLLCQHPLIAQAVVVGDGRKHLAVLIVPTSALSHSTSQESRSHMQAAIDSQLDSLSAHEQIHHFQLLANPLSIEHGELTAKLSLRRDVIQEKFREEIERLYAASE